ncbi:MAG: ribbon-helix-helix domain-containing protein [Candidatus Saccharibacteria bacterium]
MADAQTFNISFPRALVEQIDAKATEQFGSRSDFLRAAAMQYLKNETEWEYIFREGKKVGAQTKTQPEKQVADTITETRRKSGRWFTQK